MRLLSQPAGWGKSKLGSLLQALTYSDALKICAVFGMSSGGEYPSHINRKPSSNSRRVVRHIFEHFCKGVPTDPVTKQMFFEAGSETFTTSKKVSIDLVKMKTSEISMNLPRGYNGFWSHITKLDRSLTTILTLSAYYKALGATQLDVTEVQVSDTFHGTVTNYSLCEFFVSNRIISHVATSPISLVDPSFTNFIGIPWIQVGENSLNLTNDFLFLDESGEIKKVEKKIECGKGLFIPFDAGSLIFKINQGFVDSINTIILTAGGNAKTNGIGADFYNYLTENVESRVIMFFVPENQRASILVDQEVLKGYLDGFITSYKDLIKGGGGLACDDFIESAVTTTRAAESRDDFYFMWDKNHVFLERGVLDRNKNTFSQVNNNKKLISERFPQTGISLNGYVQFGESTKVGVDRTKVAGTIKSITSLFG